MHAAAFLALLTILMLGLAALRLELNFRRSAQARGGAEPRNAGREPAGPEPEPRGRRPELRSAPAGGYWQAPFPRAA